MNLELKKAEVVHRDVTVRVTYFLSPSSSVPRFDLYAVLSQEEEKIGASIEGWGTEEEALSAAKALAVKAIDGFLSKS